MNSFGELVTLCVRQLTKNLLSLLFETLCFLFADVLVNSCLCYHGTEILIHVLEDPKPYMLTCIGAGSFGPIDYHLLPYAQILHITRSAARHL
jgi:hypothetical protein